MQIYLQPQLSTVLRKLVILFKHNHFASYKSSAQNHRLRVEFPILAQAIKQFGIRFLTNVMSGYCFLYLFKGRGTLGAGMERPVGGSDEIHRRRSYIRRTGVQMSKFEQHSLLSARIQKRSQSKGIARHNNFPIQNLMGILDVRRSLGTLGITFSTRNYPSLADV